MRKIIIFNLISADGYFEAVDHGLQWHNVDAEFNNKLAIPMLEQADTLIFGRRTYELMASFWPSEAAKKDDPIVSRKMNDLDKLVFSHRITSADWQHTAVLSSIEQLRKRKETPGKAMVVLGSSDLCVSLLQAGLIDEIRLLVNPVILGTGTPIFAGLDEPLRFRLQSTKTFASGNILLNYTMPA